MAITLSLQNSPARVLSMPEPRLFAAFDGLILNTAAWSDWTPTPPFIDLMEYARPFYVQGGMTNAEMKAAGLIDEQGWVKEMPASGNPITYCGHWQHRPGKAERAGDYTLTWDGEGTISISTAGDVSGISIDYPNKTATFTLNSSAAEQFIRISILSVNTADHMRNMKLIRNDRAVAYAGGARVNPDYKAFLDQFKVAALRNLNAHGINGDAQVTWSQRKLPGGPNKGRIGWEQWVTLCNELAVPMWVCVPYYADDEYITQLATLIRDEFNASLPIYVEWSNEVWNTKFDAGKALAADAVAAWDPDGSKGYEGEKWTVRWGWHTKKAVNVALIFNTVFGEAGRSRIKHVLAGQQAGGSSGTWGISQSLRNDDDSYWKVNEPDDFVDPRTVFDFLSPSSYFGTNMIQSSVRRAAILEALETSEEAAFAVIKAYTLDIDIPDMLARLKAWRDLAVARGMGLIQYEGGQHIVQSFGLSIPAEDQEAIRSILFAFRISQHMVDCYEVWWSNIRALGMSTMAQYMDVGENSETNAWAIANFATETNLLRSFFAEKAPAPD